MKGFIEVHVNRVERLLNIRHIEMVIKNMGGSCVYDVTRRGMDTLAAVLGIERITWV